MLRDVCMRKKEGSNGISIQKAESLRSKNRRWANVAGMGDACLWGGGWGVWRQEVCPETGGSWMGVKGECHAGE